MRDRASIGRESHTTLGFTLFEVLLVVMIIGLSASLVLPGLAGARVSAKDEAARLAALFDHAQTLASVRGIPLAWQADSGGYGFYDWRGSWSTHVNDSVLRQRTLPPGITLGFASGLSVAAATSIVPPLAQGSLATNSASIGQPMLVFPGQGFMRPFRLTVTSTEGTWNVMGDVAGRISLVAAGAP